MLCVALLKLSIIALLKTTIARFALLRVTDALSTMLRLLGEELAEASWLIQVWSKIDPVELCDKE